MDYNRKTAKILYEGSLTRQKKYIMDNINFYKIQRIMNFLKWGYSYSDNSPSIYKLRRTASNLLDQVIECPSKAAYTTSGGFHAEKIDGDFLILQFVPEYWEATNDDIS